MGFLSWIGAFFAKWGLEKLYTKAVKGIKKLIQFKAIDARVDADASAEADIVKQLNAIDFEEGELFSEGKELSEEKLYMRKTLEGQLREVSSKNDSNLFN